MAAGGGVAGDGVDHRAGGVLDLDRHILRRIGKGVGESGRTTLQWQVGPRQLHGLIDVGRRLGGLGVGLQRDQLFQVAVGIDLLFDHGELDQLVSELGRVHGRQRVLVLELRRQHVEEGVEIRPQRGLGVRGRAGG